MMITSRTSLNACSLVVSGACARHHRERVGGSRCSAAERLRIRPSGRKGDMTTTTVSLDGLRELAGFRAQNGCAISLYVDLDPAISPTTRETTMRVHAMLDSAARSHGATRPDLAHEVRAGLKADFERLAQYFDGEFVRDGARGLAVFAAGPDNIWSVLALPVAGRRRRTRRGRLPARAARAADRAGQRRHRRRRRTRAGARARAPRRPARAGRRPDRGDAGPARPGRLVAVALPAAHRATSTSSTTRPSPRSSKAASARSVGRGSSSSPATRRAPSSQTPSRPRSRRPSIGWTNADAHASDAELREVVQPFVEEWRAGRESEAVERWREEVGKNALGSAGWARHARGRIRRPGRAAAPSAGRAEGRLPLPRLRARRRDGDHLPARRNVDGAPRRRARSRGPADARLRRRPARRRHARISIPSRGSARFCVSRPRRSRGAARPAPAAWSA